MTSRYVCKYRTAGDLEICWPKCPCSEVKLDSQYFPEAYDYKEVGSSCRRLICHYMLSYSLVDRC